METPGPAFPLFVQLNARLVEVDDQWREVSRWIKFQENVEDGGKRWSKPFVPSSSLAVYSELQQMIEKGAVIFNAEGSCVNSVLDDILNSEELQQLGVEEKDKIRELFDQGVKHKMKMNFVRQMSKTSVVGFSRSGSEKDGDGDQILETVADDDDQDETRETKSANTSPVVQRKTERFLSTVVPPAVTKTRKISYKDETAKFRDHNLFSKKVPKDSEAVNIQVATCNFLSQPILAFVRLKVPIILDDFCEINKPTRFLVLILGPAGAGVSVLELGRAVGSLFTDQLFCQLSAYTAATKRALLRGLKTFLAELTVLPPASWDASIRLEPPKNPPTLETRLVNRVNIRERTRQMEDTEDEEEDAGEKADEDTFLMTGKEEEEDGLQFTGRLFGGLMDDIRRKAPWYVSDFTDALNIQTIASIIYIYLATVTKAITFGGFLSDITEGLQGVLESFLGHLLAGGIFCLFGGQPLTVLGCTGPVLIFEKILVHFCEDFEIYYLTMRLWIGLWATFFCLLIVAFDLSAIVRYFTRFTEEAFAALVGIIFIVESLKKLFKMSSKYKVHRNYDADWMTAETPCRCSAPATPSTIFSADSTHSVHAMETLAAYNRTMNGTVMTEQDIVWDSLRKSECKAFGGEMTEHCNYTPDIFFLSLCLFFGTFFLASFLKKFKFTSFFPNKVRALIADYAVILTIITFVAFDHYYGLATPKLIVPTIFKPTRSDVRDWLIPMFDDKSAWYIYLLAAFPALLLTVLLFMDQQITSVIVNRKEHKLKKGCGYHLDMLVVGLMVGVCSLLGLPWCVAATVLCLGHVDSLKMDSQSTAPGETPQFEGVREQRVTGICVFLLTGLSVKLAPILLYIPMPVLYGVLMYMGVNTLKGMQFIDRMFLVLMPVKHQPDYLYLRHVPLKKVHLFTAIQAGSLAALWIIKSTPASLIFPLMVLALVGFRKAMDYFPSVFSQKELYWLDNLMPASTKKGKGNKERDKKEDNSGTDGEKEALKNGTEDC